MLNQLIPAGFRKKFPNFAKDYRFRLKLILLYFYAELSTYLKELINYLQSDQEIN